MRQLLAVLLLTASACGGADDRTEAVPLQLPDAQVEEAEWRSSPAAGVDVALEGDVVRIATGPHAVLWPAEAGALEPPYVVTATLRKLSGRTHEGYGLVFGGANLQGAEEEQSYSYFLVRGDGAFLIRRREGAEVPIVRAWTPHAAIVADDAEGRARNELSVQVQGAEAVFLVNGEEVDRQPAGALRLSGTPGVRVAHSVQLEVVGFQVSSGEAAEETGS
jgi:hypothetical protein